MQEVEFYNEATDRLIEWLNDQPEVEAGTVERLNMHTIGAVFDGGRIEVSLQHDAADPHA